MSQFLHLLADLLTFGVLLIAGLAVNRSLVPKSFDSGPNFLAYLVTGFFWLIVLIDEGMELGKSLTDWVHAAL